MALSGGNRMIVIVDYGMGNLRSVEQALMRAAGGGNVVVTSDPAVVANAERVVFPGQGAMPDCMRELDERGLRQPVIDAAKNKPFLGICIGQQMLFEHSEEGNARGLGLFPGKVRRFPREKMRAPDGGKLKVPHMGWNRVAQAISHPLWEGIENGARFYFVHSYYADPADRASAAGMTDYGVLFTSAVARDNIFAIQCHPEKSARAGLALLSNFIHWRP
ncbi:MAG: imidazole glycerol phosphate synthase subunit HisH [Candidatus Accumulibacter sp.]|jgi:glutamine amidotransferase|nr:imidazole glycerol phosphate synthase subunit HisH [Accumulibacter sp.]